MNELQPEVQLYFMRFILVNTSHGRQTPRVKLAISEVVPSAPVPSLDEYRQKIAAARQKAPMSPWTTTAETMKTLRDGEKD